LCKSTNIFLNSKIIWTKKLRTDLVNQPLIVGCKISHLPKADKGKPEKRINLKINLTQFPDNKEFAKFSGR
jgi:hypothetical protein